AGAELAASNPVTVNFIQFGGGSAVAAVNNGQIWGTSFTIAAGTIGATSPNVAVTVTDDVGNSTTRADTTNATVDDIAPVVTDAKISISGATGTGVAFRIGDTVTATWIFPYTTLFRSAGAELAASTPVTVNFSQFGGGSAVAAVNSGQ